MKIESFLRFFVDDHILIVVCRPAMLDCAKFPQDNDMCITAQSVRQGNKEEGNSRGDDDDDDGDDHDYAVRQGNKKMCLTFTKTFDVFG